MGAPYPLNKRWQNWTIYGTFAVLAAVPAYFLLGWPDATFMVVVGVACKIIARVMWSWRNRLRLTLLDSSVQQALDAALVDGRRGFDPEHAFRIFQGIAAVQGVEVGEEQHKGEDIERMMVALHQAAAVALEVGQAPSFAQPGALLSARAIR